MSTKAGTKSEEILQLQKEIIECQRETELLLYEKQWWPKLRKGLEHSLKNAGAELKGQTKRNSIQKSTFEKELENLNIKLKRTEDLESRLNESLNNMQVRCDNEKRYMESQLVKLEPKVEKGIKDYEDLFRRRVAMEKELKNCNAYCDVVYSILQLKEFKGGVYSIQVLKDYIQFFIIHEFYRLCGLF